MAKPKEALGKLTAVRLEDATYKRLEQIGLEMDRPVAWLIRAAINQFVAGYKPAKK